MDQSILERPPHGVTKRLNAEKKPKPEKIPSGFSRAPSPGEFGAAEWLEGCAQQTYAFDDFARRFHRTPFSYITMYVAIGALKQHTQGWMRESRGMLQKNHPAVEYINSAIQNLDTMLEVVKEFHDGDGNSTMPLKTVGTIMRRFVVDAAQAIEHAEIACGRNLGTCGYLEEPNADPNRTPRKKK